MDYIAIGLGLFLLIKGGDWLMEAAVAMSLKLNIPKIIIGMTVVSFATSAPELIVSIKAALLGHPDLALGNVLGSNVANLAFVLGIVILIAPIGVAKNFYKLDWPMMFLSSLIFYFFVVQDGILSSTEGLILVILLFIFLVFLLFFQGKTIEEDAVEASISSKKMIGALLVVGGFFLWLGSEVLIKGAVSLAQDLGVSERIISISIVSVGTSIPELTASVIAIVNKEKALSLGNLIGSNVFNVLAVMGITSFIQPIVVEDQNLLEVDFLWMLGISLSILPLVFLFKRYKLGRIEGVILLVSYVFFILQMIL
ncbi:calcium/sodium antiporter [Flavobacteriaceae bacterium]|nr:calcium/sodium antiporter [Flavobacteriaceae bacterium]MDC1031517.1 calcium/sodium antiporter [Flavobacteriaceae bacterium]MDC3259692.1 calcium/sodium antiporter [Flavobacteriaceae bacterium]